MVSGHLTHPHAAALLDLLMPRPPDAALLLLGSCLGGFLAPWCETHPSITQCVETTLASPQACSILSLSDDLMSDAASSQDTIAWYNFMLGMTSADWHFTKTPISTQLVPGSPLMYGNSL